MDMKEIIYELIKQDSVEKLELKYWDETVSGNGCLCKVSIEKEWC